MCIYIAYTGQWMYIESWNVKKSEVRISPQYLFKKIKKSKITLKSTSDDHWILLCPKGKNNLFFTSHLPRDPSRYLFTVAEK